MGVYIANMEMPKKCGECQFNVYPTGGSYEWQECVLLNDDITHFDIRRDDCPLIEIDEPNGILAHDIRKIIAFIDPHMIIATTYDEQIERAKAVKDWLLSIVGERRADETQP